MRFGVLLLSVLAGPCVTCAAAYQSQTGLSPANSVNINSANVEGLSKLKGCRLPDAAILALSSRNQDPANASFSSIKELNKFLGSKHFHRVNLKACKGLTITFQP